MYGKAPSATRSSACQVDGQVHGQVCNEDTLDH